MYNCEKCGTYICVGGCDDMQITNERLILLARAMVAEYTYDELVATALHDKLSALKDCTASELQELLDDYITD